MLTLSASQVNYFTRFSPFLAIVGAHTTSHNDDKSKDVNRSTTQFPIIPYTTSGTSELQHASMNMYPTVSSIDQETTPGAYSTSEAEQIRPTTVKEPETEVNTKTFTMIAESTRANSSITLL